MITAESIPETLTARAARLFVAYRAGDETKIGELVDLLSPIIWHVVRGQRVGIEVAEDVVQTTWLSLVRSADSISDPQALLQWLLVTARRESWRVVKSGDRVQPREFVADELVAPERELPEEMVLRSDDAGRLWQHFAQLPERCQALLRAIAFADRPDYAVVAKSLGMPIGSIGPTRGRCLAKLRQLLIDDPAWEN